MMTEPVRALSKPRPTGHEGFDVDDFRLWLDEVMSGGPDAEGGDCRQISLCNSSTFERRESLIMSWFLDREPDKRRLLEKMMVRCERHAKNAGDYQSYSFFAFFGTSEYPGSTYTVSFYAPIMDWGALRGESSSPQGQLAIMARLVQMTHYASERKDENAMAIVDRAMTMIESRAKDDREELASLRKHQKKQWEVWTELVDAKHERDEAHEDRKDFRDAGNWIKQQLGPFFPVVMNELLGIKVLPEEADALTIVRGISQALKNKAPLELKRIAEALMPHFNGEEFTPFSALFNGLLDQKEAEAAAEAAKAATAASTP